MEIKKRLVFNDFIEKWEHKNPNTGANRKQRESCAENRRGGERENGKRSHSYGLDYINPFLFLVVLMANSIYSIN